jgi:hypothetical protein
MNFDNLKSFHYFAFRAFVRKNVKFELSLIKWISLIFLYIFFILLESFTWLCFLLDEILYPSYRDIKEAEQSVFIIGNPRSGTTFLQRLLAKDTEYFTSMKMWEILFAPTIIQRKLIQGIIDFDQALGKPLHKLFNFFEKKWDHKNKLHKIALDAPEEDQYLFVHNWSTISVWLFGGMIDDVDSYLYFDDEMPLKEIRRIMNFYKRCIQRHIYFHNNGTQSNIWYLSKNPSASPKIDSLYRFFSDAKLIYLVRNPLDMIPSYISLLDHTWDTIGYLPQKYGGKDFVLTMAKHWYYYPLHRLDNAPEDSYIIVKFDDLVTSPQGTIQEIYQRFGFKINGDYARTLSREVEIARSYESKHDYSLGEMGLTQKKILSDYKYIFDRFEFDTEEKGNP